MVQAYWEIGKEITEAVGDRAEYGKQLLQFLSEHLTAEFGKGFTVANLRNMRQFYQTFPNRYALRSELTWTHYRLLMRVEEPSRRDFYFAESAESGWTSRQLERQINSFFYERLLATQKTGRESVRIEIYSNLVQGFRRLYLPSIEKDFVRLKNNLINIRAYYLKCKEYNALINSSIHGGV